MARLCISVLAVLSMCVCVYAQTIDQSVIDAAMAKMKARQAASSQPTSAPATTIKDVSTEELASLIAGDPDGLVKRVGPVWIAKKDAALAYPLGVAYMRMGNYQYATAPMDAALRAERHPTRAMVINHAMLCVIQKVRAGEAAKELSAYLRANNASDELAVALLGTAISKVNQNGPIFADFVKSYQSCVITTEATHPGSRMWGIRWVSQGEYDALSRQRDAALQRIRISQDKIAPLEKDLAATNDAIANAIQQQNNISTPYTPSGSIGGRSTSHGILARSSQTGVLASNRGGAPASSSGRSVDELTRHRDYLDRMLLTAKGELSQAQASMPAITWLTEFSPVLDN